MDKTTVIDNQCTHLINPGKTLSHAKFHKNAFRYFVAVIPVAIVLLISTSYQQGPEESNAIEPGYSIPGTVDSLRAVLTGNTPDFRVFIQEENPAMIQSIRNFYFRNGYKPVWTYFNGLNGRATSLLYLFEHAREYGLEPGHYHVSAIRKLQKQLEDKSQGYKQSTIGVDLEVLMTDAAFRFMVNLHAGYRSFDTSLYASVWVAKLTDILLDGIATGNVVANVLSVQPRFIEYTNLRTANEHFVRTNSLTDQWADINYPTKDTVRLQSQIRKTLKTLKYLDNNFYNTDITQALKEFQHYHGLEPDGKPGMNTVEALRQSTLHMYRILALNLDRLRKNQDVDSNLLYVNIPAYRLKVFSGNILKDTFRVIVGHPSSPTPTLSARMERIIANPTWFVPKSITMREILPKIKTDSGYLQRNGFKVLDRNFRTVNYETLNLADISESDFDYTLRQDRGLDNSLGQIKFLFSNPYSIYLHDTPGKTLFSKDLRAFSHGCIRIQNPERLAGYIINELNADSTNISRLIKAGNHHEFNISSTLAIQIMYITCEADNAGKLYFYKDIYGNDKKELEKLASFMDI
jgi:murein L,D-transpeptidase YcbB/YkuD